MLPSPNRATNTTSNEGTPTVFRYGDAKIAKRNPLTKVNMNLLFRLLKKITSYTTMLT